MASNNTAASLALPDPDFSIDENDKNLELWTFRLPVNVPLSSLKGVEMELKGSTITANFTSGGKDFCIEMGDPEENASFRVLVPDPKPDNAGDDSSSDSENEDNETKDEDEKEWNLRPTLKAFSNHLRILSAVPKPTETQLAPREGPTPVDKMRHSYSPVPQRTGLKRRWMPLGFSMDPVEAKPAKKARLIKQDPSSATSRPPVTSNHKPTAPQAITSTKSTVTKGSDDGSDDASMEDKNLSKSERKKRKAEKKAAKKAKKEAKKAKKEAKKAKKTKIKSEA